MRNNQSAEVTSLWTHLPQGGDVVAGDFLFPLTRVSGLFNAIFFFSLESNARNSG